jgi:TetR/AcrR family acrAB operon transcriptional repressor
MYKEVNLMRRTKAEAAATRRQVMNAALRVFSQKGYEATRLDDIAREAAVTRGAIYWHFSNKADLYHTLVAEAYSRINPILAQVMDAGGTVLQLLRRMFVETVSYLEDDDEFRAVSELVLFKTAATPEMEAGIRRKTEGTRALINVLSSTMQQGIDTGEIRADLNPKDGALAMLAFQNGVRSMWLLDPALFSIKDRAEALADIFIRGIAAR